METLKEAPEFRISALFKSYYVVWKPVIMRKNYLRSQQFKSYYVVWKPLLFAIIAGGGLV